ncbi:MAG: LysM peptidoglycan-binding domain-containing protein [Acidimicrobiales bacterium]
MPQAPRRLRRRGPGGRAGLAVGAALAAVAALGWLGSGPLAASGPASDTQVAARVYVVRPGDTLWAIAQRAEPGRDPRPLMDQLAAQLHGATVQPGERVLVP